MLSRKLGWALAVSLVACITFGASALAEDGLWMSDYAAAKAKAKAEKKLMLLDFTGSDWCSWCIKLHQEVFDLDAFKTEAPKKFVLVELDYPNQKVLPPEIKEQNAKLAQEFKIQGYPTIYVVDAEGRAVAKTGYQPGGPEKYMTSLNGFVTAHEKVVALKGKLEKSTGIERAKLLDEILIAQEALGLESEDMAKYEAEILTLDADNKAGLKTKYTIKKTLAEASTLAGAKKFDEAKVAYEKALALPGMSAEQKQEAYFAEAGLFFQDKDFSKVVDYVKKALAAAPTSPKAAQMEATLKRFQPVAEAQEAVAKLKPAAEAAKGVERAKVLDQLVDAQTKLNAFGRSRESMAEVEKWTQEIITLDEGNKAGLKTKYESKALMADAMKAMRAKDVAGAEAALTKALALPGLTDELKAPVLKMQKDIEAQKAKSAPPAAR